RRERLDLGNRGRDSEFGWNASGGGIVGASSVGIFVIAAAAVYDMLRRDFDRSGTACCPPQPLSQNRAASRRLRSSPSPASCSPARRRARSSVVRASPRRALRGMWY